MNVENIILKYYNVVCGICGNHIEDSAVGVTCCNTLYHRSCTNNLNMECSKCRQMYVIQENQPVLCSLMVELTDPLSVVKLYEKIYKHNPNDLYLIDNALFKNQTLSQYCNKFIGYYDYSLFNTNFNIFQLDQKWDEFSYGILTGYDWKYTYWTGHAVYSYIHGISTTEEHILLCIFNSDYRKVREQLNCLVSCIENNIRDKCFINIDEGTIILSIPGITKKICLHIEYLDKPFWYVFSKNHKYIPSYGCLYQKSKLVLTIKAMLKKYESFKVDDLQSLSKPLGYNVNSKSFSKKINAGVIDKNLLLENVYCQYGFHIKIGKNINSIKRDLVNCIIAETKNVLDVFYYEKEGMEGVSFDLVNNQETFKFSDTIITAKKVIDFVLKKVYRQPFMML